MEELASSIDTQNAEDLTRSPGRPVAPEADQQDQTSQLHEQLVLPSSQSSDQIEPETPADNPPHEHDETGSTETAFEDIFRRYIPYGSPLTAPLRERDSKWWIELFWSMNSGPYSTLDLDRIRYFKEEERRSSGWATLVIQDIKLDWCKALCSEFTEAYLPEFLADHIIRFDTLPATIDTARDAERYLAEHYPRALFEVNERGDFMAVQMEGSRIRSMSETKEFHCDLIEFPYDEVRMLPLSSYRLRYRHDFFERDILNNWRRISTRVSCCRLESLYIVLVDTAPAFESSSDMLQRRAEDPFHKMHRVFSGPNKGLVLPVHNGALGQSQDLVSNNIKRLLRTYSEQSIFHGRISTGPIPSDRRQWMDQPGFTWLLAESSWRLVVERFESRLQHLRQEDMVVAHQVYGWFIDLRRQVADAQGLIAFTRRSVEDDIKSERGLRDLSSDRLSQERGGQNVPVDSDLIFRKWIDVKEIPSLLSELEMRLAAVAGKLYDEIPIVIGSVQAEDAKVMRRQTEWTVVLAVLAAIYLPLTLVTGIFGMNIREISLEPRAPDKWATVKAWGVVFGATMGSLLVYAMARYVARYRRVGRMLFRRRLRKFRGGRLYVKIFLFGKRIEQSWLYRKTHGFRRKMREWDIEAQKLEKRE